MSKANEQDYDTQVQFPAGLTKREYFAGLAMQGLLSSGEYTSYHLVASDAVEYADVLVKELAKEKS